MLLEYLQDYTDRVKPLLDQNELYNKVLTDFEKKWDIGNFPGWPVRFLGFFFTPLFRFFSCLFFYPAN